VAIAINVFLSQLDSLIDADDDILPQYARYKFIRAAVEQYSDDSPDDVTDDVSGDGGKYYGISANLTSWVEGWSIIRSIEYPAADISSDEAPTYLDSNEDWDDEYWQGGTRYLYLPNHEPASTETMRIKYSVPYSWSASSVTSSETQAGHTFTANDYVYRDASDVWQAAADALLATHQVTAVDGDDFIVAMLTVDVPTADFFAVCNLAACLALQAMANKFSKSSDRNVINADSVKHMTRASEHAKRAKELCAMYREHMGLSVDGKGTGVKPGGEFVDWDTSPGWRSNRQYLFHRDR